MYVKYNKDSRHLQEGESLFRGMNWPGQASSVIFKSGVNLFRFYEGACQRQGRRYRPENDAYPASIDKST
jgi:hypothetical protein